MAFDRKAYMHAYNRDPKNRQSQRDSCGRYRAKVSSSPEDLKIWRDKKRAYNATARGKRTNRNRVLKFHYGISIEQYEAMLVAQDYRCLICGSKGRQDRASPLDVDHDHNTKEVRSLLCHRCNRGIGVFLENPDSLEKAAAYLRLYKRR